ncbi:MAG: cryptochrome/photolyase family protein [Pseudomonadota bacterium]
MNAPAASTMTRDDNSPALVLVLGDQLTAGRGALRFAKPGVDTVLLAEVAAEAGYVRHNRHKIALIFSAMRHFAAELRDQGFTVIYYRFDEGVQSIGDAISQALAESEATQVIACEPGEYRLLEHLQTLRLPAPLTLVDDDRFLANHEDFADWAEGRKQLRMEYFYRGMRERYQILLDEAGKPEGGKWNYDADNRSGWRGKETIPERPRIKPDAITKEVIELVCASFPDNPGDLAHFNFAVTAEGATAQLAWFIEHTLPNFGTYQDALAEESPWLFHGLVSMYLNIGLLDPLAVVQQVELAWRGGQCDLSAAEGFIRQVLGWREYVRGIYWLRMPDYGQMNSLATDRPLPGFFWNADTDMRCMQKALGQSLDLGYAHHIQRLMVIGNFALLAGLDVSEVCDWYLAVYVDAFEWVELPNTLGMALHGDGGIMASKPYAASGKYIQRQGDHCKNCRYKPAQVTGENACPYNSLYWAFLHRHEQAFAKNPRMSLALGNWRRKDSTEQEVILKWADRELDRLAPTRDKVSSAA